MKCFKQSRAAVLSFNDNIVETIDSINYDSTEKFVDRVRHLNCTDGGTNIRNGITQALDVCFMPSEAKI